MSRHYRSHTRADPRARRLPASTKSAAGHHPPSVRTKSRYEYTLHPDTHPQYGHRPHGLPPLSGLYYPPQHRPCSYGTYGYPPPSRPTSRHGESPLPSHVADDFRSSSEPNGNGGHQGAYVPYPPSPPHSHFHGSYPPLSRRNREADYQQYAVAYGIYDKHGRSGERGHTSGSNGDVYDRLAGHGGSEYYFRPSHIPPPPAITTGGSRSSAVGSVGSMGQHPGFGSASQRPCSKPRGAPDLHAQLGSSASRVSDSYSGNVPRPYSGYTSEHHCSPGYQNEGCCALPPHPCHSHFQPQYRYPVHNGYPPHPSRSHSAHEYAYPPSPTGYPYPRHQLKDPGRGYPERGRAGHSLYQHNKPAHHHWGNSQQAQSRSVSVSALNSGSRGTRPVSEAGVEGSGLEVYGREGGHCTRGYGYREGMEGEYLPPPPGYRPRRRSASPLCAQPHSRETDLERWDSNVAVDKGVGFWAKENGADRQRYTEHDDEDARNRRSGEEKDRMDTEKRSNSLACLLTKRALTQYDSVPSGPFSPHLVSLNYSIARAD